MRGEGESKNDIGRSASVPHATKCPGDQGQRISLLRIGRHQRYNLRTFHEKMLVTEGVGKEMFMFLTRQEFVATTNSNARRKASGEAAMSIIWWQA